MSSVESAQVVEQVILAVEAQTLKSQTSFLRKVAWLVIPTMILGGFTTYVSSVKATERFSLKIEEHEEQIKEIKSSKVHIEQFNMYISTQRELVQLLRDNDTRNYERIQNLEGKLDRFVEKYNFSKGN